MNTTDSLASRIAAIYENIKSGVSVDVMMLLSAALFITVIILVVLLCARARRFHRLFDEQAALTADAEEADAALLTREARISKKEEALMRREAEIEKSEARIEAALRDERTVYQPQIETQPAASTALFDIESRKLLGDARKQAYELIQQADREYLEIVSRANDEAEFIRKKANDRLLKAHESLKQSLVRSGEIIEEAYLEARTTAPSRALTDSTMHTE